MRSSTFNPPKTYIPPTLAEFDHSVQIVKENYKKEARKNVVTLIETIHNLVKKTDWKKANISEERLRAAYIGLWIVIREQITSFASRWGLWNAEFQEGYFINTGSQLRFFIRIGLKIDEEKNPLDDKSKLEYLEQFYNLFFNSTDISLQECMHPFLDILAENNFDPNKLQKDTEAMMAATLNKMSMEFKKLLQAIPTEEAITNKGSTLNHNYDEKKKQQKQNSYFSFLKRVNPNRKFAAQLIEAIITKCKPDPEDTNDESLSRSQRIKMGAMLYVMKSIDSSYFYYYFFCTARNSELYKLLADALNVEKLKHVKNYTELECLTAFQSYIRDHHELNSIENYGKTHFKDDNYLTSIDVRISSLQDELAKMIQTAKTKECGRTNWPITRFFGQLGAWIFAAPFFALGTLLGLTISESNTMNAPAVMGGNMINQAGRAMFGIHGYLGLMTAHYLNRTAWMRFAGKLAEESGMVLGYVLLASVGLGVELSYKAVCKLWRDILYLYDNNNDPMLMKNVDPEFLRTLLKLPQSVVEECLHLKIEKLAIENKVLPEYRI